MPCGRYVGIESPFVYEPVLIPPSFAHFLFP